MKFHIKEKSGFNVYAGSPEQVYTEFKALAESDQESLWILGLNCKNKVQCKEMISLGGLSDCAVYPAVVFKRLLISDCSAVILIHNHPTGQPEPSSEDVRLTSIIKDGAKIFDIKVLDHVIIGDSAYFSFREKNIL